MMGRYTRRWVQVLSRRNEVPEKWLAGVLETGLVVKTASVATRLAEEQRELKAYESMAVSSNGLDDEEQVRYVNTSPWNVNLPVVDVFSCTKHSALWIGSVQFGLFVFLVPYWFRTLNFWCARSHGRRLDNRGTLRG